MTILTGGKERMGRNTSRSAGGMWDMEGCSLAQHGRAHTLVPNSLSTDLLFSSPAYKDVFFLPSPPFSFLRRLHELN